MTRDLSPMLVSLLAKAATDNGFDRELEREGGWPVFASTECPLRVWIGAFGETVNPEYTYGHWLFVQKYEMVQEDDGRILRLTDRGRDFLEQQGGDTAPFSKGTSEAAFATGAAPITLIDGDKLIDLLIEHGIGVKKNKIEVLSVDADAFADLEPGA